MSAYMLSHSTNCLNDSLNKSFQKKKIKLLAQLFDGGDTNSNRRKESWETFLRLVKRTDTIKTVLSAGECSKDISKRN